MILYLDTSALIKLFIEEIHSDQVLESAKAAKGLACSSLGYVETHAAFARLAREGLLPTQPVNRHQELVSAFNHAWKDFIVVDASPRLIEQAARLVVPHALRGFDAVHLASALEVFHAVPKMRFACYDESLRMAAVNLGLDAMPADA